MLRTSYDVIIIHFRDLLSNESRIKLIESRNVVRVITIDVIVKPNQVNQF